VKQEHIMEFLATVAAVLVGLIAGKMISAALGKTGVPISANDPLIIPLPGTSKTIPSPVGVIPTNPNDKASAQSVGTIGA
jgi:hypothetical protein